MATAQDAKCTYSDGSDDTLEQSLAKKRLHRKRERQSNHKAAGGFDSENRLGGCASSKSIKAHDVVPAVTELSGVMFHQTVDSSSLAVEGTASVICASASPAFQSPKFSDCLPETDISLPSPNYPTTDLYSSSLFVAQTMDDQPERSEKKKQKQNASRLLPTQYDSDSEPEPVPARTSFDRAFGTNRNTVTREGTMRDAFACKRYSKSVRDNPYTSGLFDYQALAKEEARQRLRLGRRRSSESRRRRPPVLELDKLDASHLQQQQQQQQNQAKRESLREEIPQDRGTLSAAVSEDLASVYTQAESTPEANLASSRFRAQDNSVSSEADREGIANLLQQRSMNYHAILKTAGAHRHENAIARDCALLAQIEPDINQLKEMIHNQSGPNFEVVKAHVEAWERTHDLESTIKKYLMYTCLLHHVQHHGTDALD